MNTKQEIFPLYVGKCKVRHTHVYNKNTYDYSFTGIDLHDNLVKARDYTSQSNSTYDLLFDNCQLILKRISDMSEEDITKMAGELTLEWRGVRDYLKTGYTLSTKFTTDIEIVLWLIQHGYALNDEWFTNGIAVGGES